MAYSKFDLYQWMSPKLRDAFAMSARRRRYARGQAIYTQGDCGDAMYRVMRGSVRLSVARSDGREVVFLLFEPGDCFGVSSLVDDLGRPQTAEAMTEVDVALIDRAAFDELRRTSREFDEALMKLLARQMRVVSLHYAEASLDDLEARIAGRLLDAAPSLGSDGSEGIQLPRLLSQSELALMAGVSRQSVNKALQRLQAAGLVEIRSGHIFLRDPAGLARLSGG